MMNWRKILIVVALIAAWAVSAQAGQVVPFPDWWTWPPGAPDGYTRLQYHSFRSDPNLNQPPDWTLEGFHPAVADSWVAPTTMALYNQPTGYSSGLYVSDPGGMDLGDGSGLYLPDPDVLSKNMGNLLDPTRIKEWFVCVVWRGPGSATLDIDVTVSNPNITVTPGQQIDIVEPTAEGWRATLLTGTIIPQPDWEKFTFNFSNFDGTTEPMANGVWIDSIYVGTHCVPEPGTMVLLLTGGLLGLLAWRRR